jgi:hypothetical protein
MMVTNLFLNQINLKNNISTENSYKVILNSDSWFEVIFFSLFLVI